MTEAAALPETVFTVWNNLFVRGGLREDEAALVHGGASGIGTTAIQMAKAFGAQVYVTAGSDEKCAACQTLGADQAINYKSDDFAAVLGENSVDVVLDMVGGDYVPRNLQVLKPDGRHISIAFLNGPRAEINIPLIMQKRLTLTGSTLRPQPVAEKTALRDQIIEKVWPHVQNGAISPLIHATFPLSKAGAAHNALERGDHIGKIVLTVQD